LLYIVLSITIISAIFSWRTASLRRDKEALEKKVKDRTIEVVKQKENAEKQKVIAEEQRKKSDDLLLNILPAEIAEELKTSGSSEARSYNNVTVIFTDFVNFTEISSNLNPKELVSEIDRNFKAFDLIIEKHNIEKIKTIGDAYMAVCGLPVETDDHAERAILAAIDIRDYIEENKKNGGLFEVRIGVHSGPVVAGIVGIKKFAYDIWGDTVNTASRMESNSIPNKINISGDSFELVKDIFSCEHRGKIEAKGKGEVDMYFVERKIS
jgi:class 3 adenylate cyclase